jgi:drug/metabolite transporter (DMT)-like permease
MDDFSVKFPAQMEELRRGVQRDVRKSLRAAKHLVTAQVCFVFAIVLMKQSLQHFTPAGLLTANALCSLPFAFFLAKTDRAASEALGARQFSESLRASRGVAETTTMSSQGNALARVLNSWYVRFLGLLIVAGHACTAFGLELVSTSNAVVLGQLVPVYSCAIAVFSTTPSPMRSALA